jgi:hypothetical protein
MKRNLFLMPAMAEFFAGTGQFILSAFANGQAHGMT